MDPVPVQPAIPKSSVATKFLRALALRCPRCGSGGILRHWFKMRDQCPNCGLALERGESSDFWIGAYVFNLAGVMPLLLFPFSRTLWLAWDLSFRPFEPGDIGRVQ